MSKSEVFSIMGYPDHKLDYSEYGGDALWYSSTANQPTIILEFDKDDKYVNWRSPRAGGSAPSTNQQLDEINTNLQQIDQTMRRNEMMRRNGL